MADRLGGVLSWCGDDVSAAYVSGVKAAIGDYYNDQIRELYEHKPDEVQLKEVREGGMYRLGLYDLLTCNGSCSCSRRRATKSCRLWTSDRRTGWRSGRAVRSRRSPRHRPRCCSRPPRFCSDHSTDLKRSTWCWSALKKSRNCVSYAIEQPKPFPTMQCHV